MKTSLALVAASLISTSVYALPDYEPFADATGSGGTAYTVGSSLVGQVNAAGRTWTQAGPTGSAAPVIASGNLTISGLASSGGNMAQFGGNGQSARFNMSSSANSGTVYFSFAMQLSDITTLNSGGVFWAGFNNLAGSQATTPTVVDTRVITRSAVGGFNIGLTKSSGTTSDFVWSPSTFTTSDTIFLVGSYTFNPAANDDLSQLWINPSSATFGGSAPLADLSNSTGTDITTIASWILFNRNANEPKTGFIDDLRIGLTWADVTPVIPEPSSFALLGLGLLAIGRRFVANRR